MMSRHGRAAGVYLALSLAAACASPLPTQTPQPPASQAPATSEPGASDAAQSSSPPTTVPTSEAPATPAITPPPAQPSAAALITSDLEAGEIDAPTATLYRVLALFGDDRLPEKYWTGEALEDDAALDTARDEIDTYPVAIQEQLRPFLLRPTDLGSYWAVEGEGAQLTMGAAFAAVSPCVNNWITRAPATAPVIVWGACGAHIPDADALARVSEVAGFIEALWGPMTALMGPPIGDRTSAGDATEANDGKLDIYIVDNATSRHSRSLDARGNQGVCFKATPYTGPANALATSTYIVINGSLRSSPANRKSTVAHEFFHSLEAAHNRTGTLVAPDYFWMVEASAVWADHHFVPEARQLDPYRYWLRFQASPLSLSDQKDYNPYKSWAWPLFVGQEKGPPAIAAIWQAMEGKSGFTALQDATDNQLPFQTRFRDFAVRVWNENLQPGDPIDPRFQAWDSAFPAGRPASFPRWHYDDPQVEAATLGDPPKQVPQTLPSLWASYSTLKLNKDVGQLVLDFSGLSPSSALDVDALVKIKGKGWERRQLPPGKTRFCRDNNADNVEELIVVLSNHDKLPSTTVKGKWTYQGLLQFCADLSGTLTITRDGEYHEASGVPGWTRSEHLTATLLVGMTSDSDPIAAGSYVDTESSYQITRTTLESRPAGNCTLSYGTKTNGSWLFTDQPVGPDWENGITGFVDYDLGVVVLGVVVHYPYEVTEVVDCGTGTFNLEHAVHDIFGCTDPTGQFGSGSLVGTITEVDGGPDTVDFTCHEQGPGLDLTEETITISGTLTLADEPPSP